MAVPLSPLSVTVTSRGGALGADGSRHTKKNHTLIYDFFFIPATSPLSPQILTRDADNKELLIKLKCIYMSVIRSFVGLGKQRTEG